MNPAARTSGSAPPAPECLPGLDPIDTRRLRHSVRHATHGSLHGVLNQLVPGPDQGDALAELERACALSHVGVLVFPSTVDALLTALSALGFTAGNVLPSTVVRGRLAQRHHLALADLPVFLVHGTAEVPGPARIEVFMVERNVPGLPADLIPREQAEESESHLALEVLHPSGSELARLAGLLAGLGLRPDGGGFNPHESADAGGRSVLYFSAPAGGTGRTPAPDVRRIELTCVGHHPDVIHRHLDQQTEEKTP
ncbi:hypothetical protein KNE206_57500 [Kitasatospora sp. NE20-6]|uniref:hypothetical protein n=1 Tax=Kitasatospora sp. NE20-6 TaxID=2859066 RepID=UPI0034DBFE35